MNQKGVTLAEVFLTIIIALVFSLCIWSLLTAMRGCSGVADKIQKQGLKSVIERIWEGEDKQNGD